MPRKTFFLIWIIASVTIAALGFRGGDPNSPQDPKTASKGKTTPRGNVRTYEMNVLCCCDTQGNYYPGPCATLNLSMKGKASGAMGPDTIILENMSYGKEPMTKGGPTLGFQKLMLVRAKPAGK